MLPERVREFVSHNHMAVLTTFRRNGASQMSVVSVGPYRDGVAFTTTADRAKLANLKRDRRCSILVSQDDWWGYVVLEGRATVLSTESADAEDLRLALRDVYRAAGGREHPDWDEYDQAMRDGRPKIGGDRGARAHIRHESLAGGAPDYVRTAMTPSQFLGTWSMSSSSKV